MKAKLIKTNTYFNAINKIAEELKGYSRDLEERNLVFTEEKMTLLTERQIVSVLGGTFNTEVFSFIKYLKRSKRIDNLLNKEGSIMLLRKIIAEKSEGTTLFKKGVSYQYAPSVFELIAQLKSAKVTPKDLEEAKQNLQGTLFNKVNDLAYIYAEYERLLTERGFIDQNNYLNELPSVMEKEDLSNTNVFLVGFNSFTKQIKEVIKVLVKKAKSVTAILVSGENTFAYTNETVNAFLSILYDQKIKVEIEDFAPISIEGKKILENIFNPKVYKKDFSKANTTALSIYEGENMIDELERCAKIIKSKVIEEGYRYKDFTIAIENEQYKDHLSKIFERYEVPFFLDVRKNLSEHPIYSLLVSYFKNLRGAFSIKEVMNFAKNPLFCTDKDFLDDFENYLYKYNIQRAQFKKEFTFNNEKLKEFEEFRKKIIDCLSKIKEEDYAENYVKEIKNLLQKIDAENKIKELSERLIEYNQLVESSYNDKALSSVLEILDEVLKILRGTRIKFAEFSLILTSGIKAKEIPIIPQFNDAVFVGNLKQCGLGVSSHLFVLGLTHELPAVKDDVSLLSDNDLRELDKISLFVEPTIKIVNARLREDLALGLVGFSKNLYLSYPSQVGGKLKKKSEVIAHIQKMFSFDKKELKIAKKSDKIGDILVQEKVNSTRFLSKKQGEKAFALITATAKEGNTEDLTLASSYYHALEEINKENLTNKVEKTFVEELNKTEDIYLKDKVNLNEQKVSATLLESYFNCPYSSFLKNLLLLKEREVGEVQAFDIGNFIHKVLEEYSKVIDKVKNKQDSDKLAEEIANKELENYSHFLEDSISNRIITKAVIEAKRECYEVYLELQTSSFKITGVEKGFSKKDNIVLNTKNGDIFVTGKIDRVDETEDFIRIIDYKTGTQEDKNKDLYMGKKVQLFLYMNALIKSTGKNPAGVYYLPLSDDLVNLDEDKKVFFEGRSLKDEEVLSIIDNTLENGVKSSKIKVAFNKNGKIERSNASLLDKEAFNDYLKYAMLISKKGAENITDGVKVASPTEKACDYCQFKGLCSFDGKYLNKRDAEVSQETICQAVKGEE